MGSNFSFIASRCIHRLQFNSDETGKFGIPVEQSEDPVNKVAATISPIWQPKLLAPPLAKDHDILGIALDL